MKISCNMRSCNAVIYRGRELPRGYFCSVTPP